MELFIEFIFMSAFMKYCLKAGISCGLKAIGGYAAFAFLLSFALYPFLINLPVNLVSELLKDRQVVGDFAVVVTVEAVTGIMLSLKLLENYFRPKIRRSRFLGVVKVIPGILSLSGIAYFELTFFRLRAGSPFFSTVAIYALIVASSIFVVAFLLRLALPGESVKLELKMLLNLLILAVALTVNSEVSDFPVSDASVSMDYWAFAAIIALFLVFAAVGFLSEKFGFSLKSLLPFSKFNSFHL